MIVFIFVANVAETRVERSEHETTECWIGLQTTSQQHLHAGFQWIDAGRDVIDVDFDMFPAQPHLDGECGVSMRDIESGDIWWWCVPCEQRHHVVCEMEATAGWSINPLSRLQFLLK